MPQNQNIVITKSVNSISLWGHDFAIDDNTTNLKLTASTEKTVTVPPSCNIAIISYSAGSSTFVSLETLSLPGTDSNQSAFINKASLHVSPGEVLHFISPSNDYVSVSFFWNQDYQP